MYYSTEQLGGAGWNFVLQNVFLQRKEEEKKRHRVNWIKLPLGRKKVTSELLEGGGSATLLRKTTN